MKNFLISVSIIILFGLMVYCKKKSNPKPCPTTSACGCSAKTKAECDAATACCSWVVGSGCGCK